MSEALQDDRAERRRRRRRLFKVALVGGLLVGVEAASALVIAVKPRLFGGQRVVRTVTDYAEQAKLLEEWANDDVSGRVFVPDPVLGWTVQPDSQDEATAINVQGLRSERVYAPQPPPGVLRVSAFGDSFVYATEVDTDETWTAQLEAAAPIELLNYGVAAYGPDQALLRFRAEGGELAPHVVLLGIADPNVARVVNRYRHLMFRGSQLGFKPRVVIEGDALRVIPNPLPEREAVASTDVEALVDSLRDDDRFYEPVIYDNPLYDWSATMRVAASLWVYYRHRFASDAELIGGRGAAVVNPASEAFAVLTRVAQVFAAEVEAQGRRPAIVLFPTQDSVERVRGGGRAILAPLADHLRELGLVVLDLSEAFAAADAPAGGAQAWFRPRGHYSPEGNAVVASWLAERLPGLREAHGGK